MEKIILYYKFVPIIDPETTKLWQLELCARLGLKGRIIVSTHGINGTLGGNLIALRSYKSTMNKTTTFKGIVYKWSEGRSQDFPRLSVRVRDEIVSFGAADELKVSEKGIVNGGIHLKPEEVHQLIKERGDEVVFFDGRNKYESNIGKFKNAITPSVDSSRDFITELEKPEYDDLKNKPVITYCTGGIRCEIITALMKNRGFNEVYQIDGGIVKYGEKYADNGNWEGKLFVFDNRMSLAFSDTSKDIGICIHCSNLTSNYINCANKQCNKLVLVCSNCAQQDKFYCEQCQSIAYSVTI